MNDPDAVFRLREVKSQLDVTVDTEEIMTAAFEVKEKFLRDMADRNSDEELIRNSGRRLFKRLVLNMAITLKIQ
ncbi:MAG: hypothetical protein GF372_09390 [Candidatus Marinimicrobia bacterium]|nr:hypothetical protein [Candidatus Neomarinimicrobiota bacterium]